MARVRIDPCRPVLSCFAESSFELHAVCIVIFSKIAQGTRLKQGRACRSINKKWCSTIVSKRCSPTRGAAQDRQPQASSSPRACAMPGYTRKKKKVKGNACENVMNDILLIALFLLRYSRPPKPRQWAQGHTRNKTEKKETTATRVTAR